MGIGLLLFRISASARTGIRDDLFARGFPLFGLARNHRVPELFNFRLVAVVAGGTYEYVLAVLFAGGGIGARVILCIGMFCRCGERLFASVARAMPFHASRGAVPCVPERRRARARFGMIADGAFVRDLLRRGARRLLGDGTAVKFMFAGRRDDLRFGICTAVVGAAERPFAVLRTGRLPGDRALVERMRRRGRKRLLFRFAAACTRAGIRYNARLGTQRRFGRRAGIPKMPERLARLRPARAAIGTGIRDLARRRTGRGVRPRRGILMLAGRGIPAARGKREPGKEHTRPRKYCKKMFSDHFSHKTSPRNLFRHIV